MENMHLDTLHKRTEYRHLILETTPIQVTFNFKEYSLNLSNLSTDPGDSTLRLCFPSGMQCSVQRIEKGKEDTKWRAVFEDFKKKRRFESEEASADQLVLDDKSYKLFINSSAQHNWHFLFTYPGEVFRWRDIEHLKPVFLQPGYGNGHMAEDDNTRVFMQSHLQDFCNAFFDRRKETNFHIAQNASVVLDCMPPDMSSCTLVPGERPIMSGQQRSAEAIIKYKDRDGEKMELSNTTIVLNLFEKWIGHPFYNRDAWMEKEQTNKAEREKTARLQRQFFEEAAKEAAEKARIEEEGKARHDAEMAERKAEEAAKELVDPTLTIDSMRKGILDYFESVKATYPGFKPSTVNVKKMDGSLKMLHLGCTIDLNPRHNVISPMYPNAKEIYSTNRWMFPIDNTWGHQPAAVPVKFIILPDGQDIVELLKMSSQDRVSDITQCLKYVFPENNDQGALIRTAEKQAERQAQEEIQTRLDESKRRVTLAMLVLAKKLIKDLENEMKGENLTITNPQGVDVSMSLHDTCLSLDVNARACVDNAFSRQPTLKSAITKVTETLNRITLHLK
jgi:hypothetical protein